MWGRFANGVVFRGAVRANWRGFLAGMLVALLAAASPGCGGGGDGEEEGEQINEVELRRQFIRSVGNRFILPTLTVMAEEAIRLRDSVSNFCASRTNDSLASAQQQWRMVTGLWMESELVNVRFGPAHTLGEFVRVSWARGEHADTGDIEARIADDRHPAANERGLEGIEYLLFGNSDDSTVILDSYEGAMGERRCDYLEEIASSLQGDIEEILVGWESDGGDYIGVWNSAGEPANTTYRSVQSAIDGLMSRVEFVIDELVNRKLQRVNWKDREPDMWRSGNAIANVQHHFAAAEMIYLGIDRGEESLGLDAYVQQRGGLGAFGMDDYLRQTGDSQLDIDIRDQFDLALDVLEAIPVPLREAVNSHPGLVTSAIVESRELLRLLKRELAQDRLGVFFEFNSSDGGLINAGSIESVGARSWRPPVWESWLQEPPVGALGDGSRCSSAPITIVTRFRTQGRSTAADACTSGCPSTSGRTPHWHTPRKATLRYSFPGVPAICCTRST